MALMSKKIVLFVTVLFLFSCSDIDGSPQQADPDFIPKNLKQTFSNVDNPRVLIDEAHNNFHTASGRYKAFQQVLVSDGYTVKPNRKVFTLDVLKNTDILVIANALDTNRHDWMPPFEDAFQKAEVQAIKQWVSDGGSLLLIADHIPFPKAAESLTSAFGFEFSNGHVDKALFRIKDGSLAKHAVTKSSIDLTNNIQLNAFNDISEPNPSEFGFLKQVKTFGGSAFTPPKNAKSILTLGSWAFSRTPEIPFQIKAETPKISMDGWSQGAILEFGNGRVAVFSEAMMFTSQLYVPTGEKMGLTSKGAEDNEQFVINVMHWLSGLI
ncbi:DUF4350 domain-containing protein [Ningiella sp. W23]|uniref:DUF4350 domain-containing protein n=1 Tax=Glaciecola siphonariae TaxID=521012 RepID=A0ABV9LV07_9ALTE